METGARFHDDGLNKPSDARVDEFFDTLCREQIRFLQAFGHARSLLGSESGQLAHVTAIQGRLTRQFFDAQRGLMRRRADVDAEVAEIAAAAAQYSSELVEGARAQVAAGLVPPTRIGRDVVVAEGELSDQQQIASLGVSVVHTMEEADVLAAVINDAFESREPDGAAAERQLAAILDEWWAVELQESGAVVDDANARAAVRRHIGAIEADEILDAARAKQAAQPPKAEPAQVLPSVLPVAVLPITARPIAQLPNRVIDLTNNADTSDLAALFAELAASLAELPATEPTPPAIALALKVDLAPAESPSKAVVELQMPVAEPDDPFRVFWEQGPFGNGSSNGRHRGGIA